MSQYKRSEFGKGYHGHMTNRILEDVCKRSSQYLHKQLIDKSKAFYKHRICLNKPESFGTILGSKKGKECDVYNFCVIIIYWKTEQKGHK